MAKVPGKIGKGNTIHVLIAEPKGLSSFCGSWKFNGNRTPILKRVLTGTKITCEKCLALYPEFK